MATEFSGDRRIDLLARNPDGTLLMYRGNGRGGFVTGTGESLGGGWQGLHLARGARRLQRRRQARHPRRDKSDGALLLYRGNGDSGFATAPQVVGGGWAGVHGDPGTRRLERRRQRRPARACSPTGTLLLYRGNGHCGLDHRQRRADRQRLGPLHRAARPNGDFNGDGFPDDILARNPDGALLLYRGNGTGGFRGPYPQIGTGWQSLNFLMLVGQGRKPPPAMLVPTPPSVPLQDGRVHTQRRRRLRPARRPGPRREPEDPQAQGSHAPEGPPRRVLRPQGVRGSVDRKRPYAARLRLRRPAGSKGRVYARVFFRRPGTKKVRKKTVARRYVMCG